jgi:hypothetical protein
MLFYTPSFYSILVFGFVYVAALFVLAYVFTPAIALTFAIAFALGQVFQNIVSK